MHGYPAAVALTHDSTTDDPALQALINTRVGYKDAISSRQSHSARIEWLLEDGASEESNCRIESPCGIHFGSSNALDITTGILAGLTCWHVTNSVIDRTGSVV